MMARADRDPQRVIDSLGFELIRELVVRLKEQISSQSNFLVAGQRVDFHGWCVSCAAAKKQTQPSPA